MDKKLRNLLILGGLLILLCAGYAVAGLVFKEDTPEDETTAETTAEEASFLSVTEDGLTALTYTYDANGDGVAETWSYTRSADGETWHWDDDPAVPLGSSAFYGYSSTLYGIKAVNTLRNVSEAQFTEYGLDKPVRTVTFTDKVGGAQTFCIGAYNTYNGTYCAYKNGDKTTVYLLDGAFYPEFDHTVEYFVYHDDLPAFKPEGLNTLTLTQGDRTVTLTRETDGEGKAVWHRSVNGESPVTVAADLVSALELLVGDMDYLACLSVRESDFSEYGLHENTTRMTLVYTKTENGEEVEKTFTLTLGSTDKYGYYYANPEGTTLTMLLGGSVFHKTMTYDDEHVAAGDPVETDTATP